MLLLISTIPSFRDYTVHIRLKSEIPGFHANASGMNNPLFKSTYNFYSFGFKRNVPSPLPFKLHISERKNKTIIFKNTSLKWLCFWVVGFNAISAGVMQAFNPSYTANLLHVAMIDFIVVEELGLAQLGIGIVAWLSLKWVEFRKPAVIAYGIFIFGCTVIHFLRFSTIDMGEIISTLNDIWILIVVALIVINKENTEIADCGRDLTEGKL